MPTLILADLHGNLPALQAILASPQAQSCSRIVSLGDHVNFGPQSRAVHDQLTALGAVMLLGNHEERLLRPEDADFDGYNWRLMRWTATRMQGADLRLPVDHREGSVLMTHGVPGDPYRLVSPADLPGVLDTLPQGVTLLLSGHNHLRWDVTHRGLRAFNPGSAGMAEDGCGSRAPFAILEGSRLIPCEVPYNVTETARAFLQTGACRIAPEMCRMVLHVMRTAEYQGVLKLIRHVHAAASGTGLSLADEAAWKAADLTYPWPEKIASEEYWKQMEYI